MVIDQNFWCGKRVFLTGHTGFKGGWLAIWLQSLGAEVFGYSLAPATEPNFYSVAKVSTVLAGEVIADLGDLAALGIALQQAKPDVIFHLAAQAIVLQSYQDPVQTFATNVVGTVALLDALRALDTVRAVVVVTSDKCYENQEWVWGYRESDRMGGHDPYSASKGAAELAVSSMRRSYFSAESYKRHRVGIATARAGNVIGGGDWAPHRLIPDLIRALGAEKPCIIRNPNAVRPWQHVLEPLAGYLALAAALWRDGPAFSGGWNFGPRADNAKPVKWIADYLSNLWPGAAPLISAEKQTLHENSYLKLDISKATAALDWAPVWCLQTSLGKVIEWHHAHRNGAEMRDCALAQITQFCDDACA